MQDRILIVTNGDLEENFIKKIISNYDFIISVDGAYNTLYKLGIIPNIMIGDFDSINKDIFLKSDEYNIEKINLRSDKDFSDTASALDLAIERGYNNIDIIGGIGTRWDHSLANINLLYYGFEKKANVRLLSDDNKMSIYSEGEYDIAKDSSIYWSFFPVFDDVTISLINMKYELNKRFVRKGDTLGLSNELIDNSKFIVHSGNIIVVESKKDF